MNRSAEHLYLQVAEGLEKLIADETLRIGDKLPSVRILSEEYGISMGTAFQAYYHLEGKGLIESRPKSGYYVRFNHRRFPGMPAASAPVREPHEVSVREMIASIYSDIASKDVVNLALAVPDQSLLPAAKISKSVQAALRASDDSCLGYADTQGLLELRKQLSRLAFNWGGRIKPEEIVVTNGCMEAVSLCLKAVTKAGDTVAVECPTYFGIYQAAESLGLKVVEIPTDPVTGLDPSAFEKAIRKYPVKACVLIPNFNNPMGGCMPDENKRRITEFATRKKIPLIEDDIYGELYFDKTRPRTCKSFDREGWVMHCSSLSKSLTPGFRTGWVIPGRFLDRVKQLKRTSDISCATITQAAMAHFLQHGRYEYHLKNLRRALHTQSLRYIQAILDHFPPDTRVSRPRGGFILWVELNRKVDSFRLRTEAMKLGISVMPGRIFAVGCDYSNCIRISFGRPWDAEVAEGLRQLGKIIGRMIKQ